LTGKPYYVAYSGGKDSDAIRILCQLADVPHDLVHNHTTVDAPETVYYVRSIPDIQIEYPKISMWNLIIKKQMPPIHTVRYCCAELKEAHGKNRFLMTGVRWSESSARRKMRGGLELLSSNPSKKLILNADNAENRQLLETCQLKGKRVLNPIIDWSDDDVWEFLNSYGCKSNPLYQEGCKRVGCIGCPLASIHQRRAEFKRWPKYFDMYLHAFKRMLMKNKSESIWNTEYDVMDWWLRDKPKYKNAEKQIKIT
jgi:phosphoadenosine phosphosulfate reductase